MNEVKSNVLQDVLKKSKSNLIIWLFVVILSVVIFSLGFLTEDQAKKKAVSLHDIIVEGDISENKMVYVNSSEIPYAFAYYPDDSSGKFYFLWDENYMYVSFLSESEFNKLNHEDIKNNPSMVYGVTKNIPDDIKKLALDAYNEAVEEEYQINESEFADYFGVIYLDATETTVSTVVCIALGIIGLIIGVVGLLITGIVRLRLTSKIKKINSDEWEMINRELEEEESFYYKNAKLALTRNYIVDFSKGLKVIRYEDVLWIYKFEYRQNGIKTQDSIVLITKDKKKHMIASLGGYTKKSKEVSKEIIETIYKKNDSMLVGYTKENRQKMKEKFQIKA